MSDNTTVEADEARLSPSDSDAFAERVVTLLGLAQPLEPGVRDLLRALVVDAHQAGYVAGYVAGYDKGFADGHDVGRLA